jgi:TPP-dependent pyruvate/acetoin dehydrogenase alpha subunit
MGAANQDAFDEQLNLAVLWQLPVFFVVEDDDCGICVPRSQCASIFSNVPRRPIWNARRAR